MLTIPTTASRSMCAGFDRIKRIQEQSERGGQALEDVFGAVLNGADSAKEAVVRLLMEIAKAQFIKGMMGMPGMGELASGIGSLLVPGFASGGSHGGGLRIVGENGPELEATGASRIWNADQTQKMMQRTAPSRDAQQQGGPQARSAGAQTTHVTIDLSGTTGDKALDQKLGQLAREIMQEAEARTPKWMHNWQKREG